MHQNAPILQLMKNQDYDDAEPVSLQMMMHDYFPIDSGEVEYLNLLKARMVPPHFCH